MNPEGDRNEAIALSSQLSAKDNRIHLRLLRADGSKIETASGQMLKAES
jgi:hypothetical protein